MAFTGGVNDAIRRSDRQMAGWTPPLNSADLDILPDKDLNDARSRDIMRNDGYVQGGATIHKDGIVGSLYFLSAKPNVEALPDEFTEDWAAEFQREAEAKFTLFAESPRKWMDASRNHTLTSMIRLAVGVYATGSEVLATCEWITQKGREYKTAIQMVDTDRLATPPDRVGDATIRAGIKKDRWGAAVSYFIRRAHQHDIPDFASFNDSHRFREVKAEKPWGRQQVIHIREQQRVDQTRAVSDMVAGLKELKITRKFRDVTLQNAVVNAMYAASIESELPAEVAYAQMGGSTGEAIADYAESYLAAIAEYTGSANNLKMDGVKVPHMFPGTKLQLRPAGAPGGVGQEFEQSLLRYIAAILGISYEELSRDYTKTNYSSARAAMANTWRFLQSRKKFVADEFATAVFRLWLEEAINNDRLRTFPASKAALLYTDGSLNMMFDALASCDWIGASRGQIDELKETQAAVLRIKYGLSTHEDELARLGKDWRKVYAQLEREADDREERGIVLVEDNSVNAASGSPREVGEGNEEDQQNAA
jgi:lambda family phage portal protein